MDDLQMVEVIWGVDYRTVIFAADIWDFEHTPEIGVPLDIVPSHKTRSRCREVWSDDGLFMGDMHEKFDRMISGTNFWRKSCTYLGETVYRTVYCDEEAEIHKCVLRGHFESWIHVLEEQRFRDRYTGRYHNDVTFLN